MESDEQIAQARVGQVLRGKWALEALLGVGGTAAVYAGRDPEGTRAAIKILHPEIAQRPELRERFLHEGYAANQVGHPGVIRVLEHDSPNDATSMLVMELLDGETLGDVVRRPGGLPVADLLSYVDQLLDVLVAAHDKSIIHRDLKPENLFVTRDGQLKVLDFGIARLHDSVPRDHRTRTGIALGTLPYMAPEQALGRNKEIDARTDLYSVGAMCFRILSGRKIHEADSEAEVLMAMASQAAPPLARVAPNVPADVCEIVDVALSFAREARYPDARTMQADVRAVREGRPPPFAKAKLAKSEEATNVSGAVPAISSRAEVRAAAFATADPAAAGSLVAPAAEPTMATAPGVPAAMAPSIAGPVSHTAPLSAPVPHTAPLLAPTVAGAVPVSSPVSAAHPAHAAVAGPISQTVASYEAVGSSPTAAGFDVSPMPAPVGVVTAVSVEPRRKKGSVLPLLLGALFVLLLLGGGAFAVFFWRAGDVGVAAAETAAPEEASGTEATSPNASAEVATGTRADPDDPDDPTEPPTTVTARRKRSKTGADDDSPSNVAKPPTGDPELPGTEKKPPAKTESPPSPPPAEKPASTSPPATASPPATTNPPATTSPPAPTTSPPKPASPPPPTSDDDKGKGKGKGKSKGKGKGKGNG